MVQKAGYECEVHQVETEDGYILKVHRIKPARNVLKNVNEIRAKLARPTSKSTSSNTKDNKRVVFLMHGMINTAAAFLLTGKNHALREFTTAFYIQTFKVSTF